MATLTNPETPLSQVPLTDDARQQLRKARTIVATSTGIGAVIFIAAIVAAAVKANGKHSLDWAAAITPIVIIVGLIAFGLFRVYQLSRDLQASSMTRFTGDWRERLSTPRRNSTFLRVKLPGRFMLLRSSAGPTVAAAAQAGVEKRWTSGRGHVDYSSTGKLLVAITRDPA